MGSRRLSNDDSVDIGIEYSSDQMTQGLCTMSVDNILGHKSGQEKANVNVKTMLQDVTFVATFFIGTVLVVSILYSGFLYITGKDEGSVGKAKKGIQYSIIGFLLVIGSYAIIRLVQYIAKG